MRRERRKNFRVEWNSPATIYYGTLARPCVVINFSNGGARITAIRAATVPNEFMLRITPGRAHKCLVLWRSVNTLGVAFIDQFASTKEDRAARTVREPA